MFQSVESGFDGDSTGWREFQHVRLRLKRKTIDRTSHQPHIRDQDKRKITMNERPLMTPLAESLPSTVPFVGPETLERQTGKPFLARIGANESGFGPSPKVIKAMEAAAAESWKYADPENFELKAALAAHLGPPSLARRTAPALLVTTPSASPPPMRLVAPPPRATPSCRTARSSPWAARCPEARRTRFMTKP